MKGGRFLPPIPLKLFRRFNNWLAGDGKMNKEQYKRELKTLVAEDEGLAKGKPEEIIYMLDNIVIFGEFDMGIRGVDHNILVFEDVTWAQIIEWGILVISERKIYISDILVPMFHALRYKRLSTNDNSYTKN